MLYRHGAWLSIKSYDLMVHRYPDRSFGPFLKNRDNLSDLLIAFLSHPNRRMSLKENNLLLLTIESSYFDRVVFL